MPQAAKIQFKRGLLANLPQQMIDGTLYVTTDEHAMYMDVGSSRIRLGDFVPVDTLADLNQLSPVYETAIYYVKEGNILARRDTTNNRWIQINKAGIVGVTTTGTGNVISEIGTSVDGTTGQMRLTVTKVSVATADELDSLISRVTTNETNISTLQTNVARIDGDVNTSGSFLNAIEQVRQALLGSETTYTTFKLIGDAIRTIQSNLESAQTDIENLQSDMTAAKTTIAEHTSALATLNGDATTEGSVAYAVAQEAAARQTADDALDDRLDTVESTLDGLPERVETVENAIETLNGDATTAGSVANTVAGAIAQVVNEAPESFDTLKEISDWISSHSDSAAAMNSSILELTRDLESLESNVTTNTTDISDLKTRMATAEGNITNLQSSVTTLNGDVNTVGSVAYQIDQAIDGVESDLDDLASRVAANKTAIDLLNGDAETAGSVAYAVAGEATLRDAADQALQGSITALGGRVTTVEGNITTINNTLDDMQSTLTDHETRLTWIEY